MIPPAELLEDAVSVSTTVTVDWQAFGRAVARSSSGDQAAFLEGLREGFGAMGEVAATSQIAFIGQCMPMASARWDEVAELLAHVSRAIVERAS